MAESVLPLVTIWTNARHAAQVGRILDRLHGRIQPVGLGGPPGGKLDELGRQLNLPVDDDLRKILVAHPTPFILLATTEGVTREDLVTALAQESVILALEPVAAGFDELPSARPRAAVALAATGAASVQDKSDSSAFSSAHGGQIISIPAFTCSQGWTSAANPQEVLGHARLIAITSFGSPDECSLFSRLHDAFAVIHTLVAMPESIDAMLVSSPASDPLNSRNSQVRPTTRDPRQITGHLAAFARLPDGATAVLQVSDQTGPHTRQLTIVGDQGRIRAGDLDYDLSDHAGHVLDHHKTTKGHTAFSELVAWQWTKLIQRPSTPANPDSQPDEAKVLASCLACLLSARTGQPESPAKLLSLRTG